jgi:hypothetical protein
MSWRRRRKRRKRLKKVSPACPWEREVKWKKGVPNQREWDRESLLSKTEINMCVGRIYLRQKGAVCKGQGRRRRLPLTAAFAEQRAGTAHGREEEANNVRCMKTHETKREQILPIKKKKYNTYYHMHFEGYLFVVAPCPFVIRLARRATRLAHEKERTCYIHYPWWQFRAGKS